MKKYLPYILIGVIIIGALALFLTGAGSRKQFDERISFRKRDKIPYGMYVAYEHLSYLFPGARINTEHKGPGLWDSLSMYSSNQALMIVSPQFNPDETEMRRLISFVENGNDVWISTMRVSYYAEKFIKCDIFYPAGVDQNYFWEGDDSLTVSIKPDAKGKQVTYSYPGKAHDFWFNAVDTATTVVLGYNDRGKPNFIRLSAGKGNLFLHLAPLAFSNYFLLHHDNIAYYENALSFLKPGKEKLVWDEYFLTKKGDGQDKNRPSWLKVFLSKREFFWAFMTALVVLVLYVLMEMRRKQRPIPVINRPKNDSLDFVKTIGRLYHDKGDHHNLARKMTAYFLEHVRNRYKLNTSELNEEFINNLQYKSGVELDEIRELVGYMSRLDDGRHLSAAQLTLYHKKLESFYQKA